MIRSFEKSHPDYQLSKRAAINGRTPIFCVSASLVEKERQMYMDAGFDAWILKPIDFKRLAELLEGIVDDRTRTSCLYEPGHWDSGGWFCRRQPDVFSANTAPSATAPVTSSTSIPSCPVQPEESTTDQERGRLSNLQDEAVQAKSEPRDPGSSGDIQQSLETEGTTRA